MSVPIVIPARGGSQGVLKKNLRLVGGESLVGRAVRVALEADIGPVYVSTDDYEISEAVLKVGAQPVWRPKAISGDEAVSEDAVIHVLQAEEITDGAVVMMQCTSPLTLPEDIRGIVKVMEDEAADSALSVTEFYGLLWGEIEMPSQEMRAFGTNHRPWVLRKPRQQRDANWLENGALYAMRAGRLAGTRNRFFGKIALYEMPAERSWEIDSELDFPIVEALLNLTPKPLPTAEDVLAVYGDQGYGD